MSSGVADRRRAAVSRAIRVAVAFIASSSLLRPADLAAQAAAGATPDDTEARSYRIAPGDVLSLFVWKEPDLTREIVVGSDGRISVPLLGDVDAEGKDTAALTSEIRERLERFMSVPSVTVGVKQYNNSYFYAVGRVNRPGEYPLRGRTTFLQALAVAGGFAAFAKTDRVLIVRREGNADKALFIDYKKLEQGEDLAQNLVLRPADTIVVQ